MSTMPSFDTGVAAMMAQATAMDAISQNIANLRTPGYRRADTTFATLLSGVEVGPYKPGGVTAQTRKLVDVEGTLEQTGRPLDIALSGKGMLVYSSETTGAGDLSYSRRGSLSAVGVDSAAAIDGYLSAYEDLYLMAWPLDASGALVGNGRDDMVAIPAAFNDPFAGRATATATLSAVIPASGATAVDTELFYVDAAGVQQQLRLGWTNTGINTWDVQAYDSTGTPLGAPDTLVFDDVGALPSGTTISPGGLFTLDVGDVTQRGSVLFRGLYVQDGLAAGDFLDYEIDTAGVVHGRYTSGAVAPLFQLPVAVFANPNGLTELPGDLWVESDKSGSAGYLSASTVARVSAGARELGNVDLADSFTQMIVTQRAYSSAAQLVRTADEMTQTVRDLR